MNAHSLAVYVIAVVVAMIAPGPDMMFVLNAGQELSRRVCPIRELSAAGMPICAEP